ncbi:hypothetical protein HDU76_014034 [Blyttiomyces sp. JEL0837]|nr:hypothetical protein HDU76_014034 [Blyttiomyces sp. JEL0837]
MRGGGSSSTTSAHQHQHQSTEQTDSSSSSSITSAAILAWTQQRNGFHSDRRMLSGVTELDEADITSSDADTGNNRRRPSGLQQHPGDISDVPSSRHTSENGGNSKRVSRFLDFYDDEDGDAGNDQIQHQNLYDDLLTFAEDSFEYGRRGGSSSDQDQNMVIDADDILTDLLMANPAPIRKRYSDERRDFGMSSSIISSKSAPVTYNDDFDPNSYLGADSIEVEEYRKLVEGGLRRAMVDQDRFGTLSEGGLNGNGSSHPEEEDHPSTISRPPSTVSAISWSRKMATVKVDRRTSTASKRSRNTTSSAKKNKRGSKGSVASVATTNSGAQTGFFTMLVSMFGGQGQGSPGQSPSSPKKSASTETFQSSTTTTSNKKSKKLHRASTLSSLSLNTANHTHYQHPTQHQHIHTTTTPLSHKRLSTTSTLSTLSLSRPKTPNLQSPATSMSTPGGTAGAVVSTPTSPILRYQDPNTYTSIAQAQTHLEAASSPGTIGRVGSGNGTGGSGSGRPSLHSITSSGGYKSPLISRRSMDLFAREGGSSQSYGFPDEIGRDTDDEDDDSEDVDEDGDAEDSSSGGDGSDDDRDGVGSKSTRDQGLSRETSSIENNIVVRKSQSHTGAFVGPRRGVGMSSRVSYHYDPDDSESVVSRGRARRSARHETVRRRSSDIFDSRRGGHGGNVGTGGNGNRGNQHHDQIDEETDELTTGTTTDGGVDGRDGESDFGNSSSAGNDRSGLVDRVLSSKTFRRAFIRRSRSVGITDDDDDEDVDALLHSTPSPFDMTPLGAAFEGGLALPRVLIRPVGSTTSITGIDRSGSSSTLASITEVRDDESGGEAGVTGAASADVSGSSNAETTSNVNPSTLSQSNSRIMDISSVDDIPTSIAMGSVTPSPATVSALQRQMTQQIPTAFYRNGIHISVNEPTLSGDKGFTVYKITVKLLRPNIPSIGNETACTFTVYKRYTEFRAFYVSLVKAYKNTVFGWPDFPHKSFFDRFNPTTITSRLSSFATLLTYVSLHPQLYNSAPLLTFLNIVSTDTDHRRALTFRSIGPSNIDSRGLVGSNLISGGSSAGGGDGGVVLYEKAGSGSGSGSSGGVGNRLQQQMMKGGLVGTGLSRVLALGRELEKEKDGKGGRSYSNPL